MKKIYRGQSLIELLLTIGLAAILLPALLVGLYASRSGRAQTEQRVQAYTQLRQIEEGVRSIRESGWTNIATDGTYHVVPNGTAWSIASSSATQNGFTQQLVIGNVYRDTTGNIATSSGTLDPSTKLVTATVSWTLPYPSSVSNSFYLARYLHNFATIDTSVSDFNAGFLSATTVTNKSGGGGEVILGKGGNADWCQPQNSLVNTLTLPKQGNTIYALNSGAYIGTGDGTQGVTFVNVAISQPPPPASPSASVAGVYSSSYQTNDIFSDGRYVYLATNGSAPQVIILDLTQNPYNVVGTISVPSGVGANGVYVSNNIGYVTSGNKLYTYDLSTVTGSHTTPLASVAMWIGIGSTPLAKQVTVLNGYAYVGTQNTLFGLQKFSVSNGGRSFRLVGVSNLTWQQSSQGLVVKSDGSRAYIAFNNGAGFFPKGFFIVDTSPADPPPWWPFPNFYDIIGTYNTGATDPDGMALASSTRAIVVGNGGVNQYQVIDISNESSPVYCGGMSITSGVSGVATILLSNANAYSYIITGETKNQFKIIEGGIGGGYTPSGTFESRIFDANGQASFNRFLADINQPSQTTIKMQVGVAPPVSSGCNNIPSFTYLGPNNDPTQYFTPIGATISATIPFGSFGANYSNPSECYRYKVFFQTSDISQTPTLEDVITNYSL